MRFPPPGRLPKRIYARHEINYTAIKTVFAVLGPRRSVKCWVMNDCRVDWVKDGRLRNGNNMSAADCVHLHVMCNGNKSCSDTPARRDTGRIFNPSSRQYIRGRGWNVRRRGHVEKIISKVRIRRMWCVLPGRPCSHGITRPNFKENFPAFWVFVIQGMDGNCERQVGNRVLGDFQLFLAVEPQRVGGFARVFFPFPCLFGLKQVGFLSGTKKYCFGRKSFMSVKNKIFETKKIGQWFFSLFLPVNFCHCKHDNISF